MQSNKFLSVKKRVYDINEQLFKLGYTYEMIVDFWNDCLELSQLKLEL